MLKKCGWVDTMFTYPYQRELAKSCRRLSALAMWDEPYQPQGALMPSPEIRSSLCTVLLLESIVFFPKRYK